MYRKSGHLWGGYSNTQFSGIHMLTEGFIPGKYPNYLLYIEEMHIRDPKIYFKLKL